jgi:hypothetical protein
MSESKPNLEGPSEAGSPIVNETRLEATNSQIVNASQVVNSPGAIVYQIHEQQSSAVPGILAGMFGALLFLVAVLSLLGKVVPSGLAVFLIGMSAALIVGGFFSWAESLLRSATKSEIAVWLLGAQSEHSVRNGRKTFIAVYKALFVPGFSWQSFFRSAMVGTLAFVFYGFRYIAYRELTLKVQMMLAALFVYSAFAAYLSVLRTYFFITIAEEGTERQERKTTLGALFFDIVLADWMLMIPLKVFAIIDSVFISEDPVFGLLLIPCFFSSAFLWLYAGSGFLLKAARRFDIGFQWFNRKFDIEKKPLQSIGLVAGALVAMLYWGFALGTHLLR